MVQIDKINLGKVLQSLLLVFLLCFFIPAANNFSVKSINEGNYYSENYTRVMEKGYATELEMKFLEEMEEKYLADSELRNSMRAEYYSILIFSLFCLCSIVFFLGLKNILNLPFYVFSTISVLAILLSSSSFGQGIIWSICVCFSFAFSQVRKN
ncbi:hypothetical protein PRUB_a2975 [Pseudoalteromonas rubra]|uniref:Uncharacterized protein n=1 Tax=Pseudoalteromonas rubra TaxID=43658 RepID=A0A8T0CED6_9GAMM|nr:hypothetical protein [Pseudoalteromonas rubra]KAF7788341.1 hypothetical protein PRUB_a2975 [Pseudoalteromonas rubra]